MVRSTVPALLADHRKDTMTSTSARTRVATIASLALALFITTIGTSHAGHDGDVVDQQMPQQSLTGISSIDFATAQSFTPTQPTLTGFDVLLGTMTADFGRPVSARLVEGVDPDGAILFDSGPIDPGPFTANDAPHDGDIPPWPYVKWVSFHTGPISVTPGTQYSITLSFADGTGGWLYLNSDPYPGGRLYHYPDDDAPYANDDAAFRTYAPAPAPATKADCKKGGWATYGDKYRNQGDCVSKFSGNGKNKN